MPRYLCLGVVERCASSVWLSVPPLWRGCNGEPGFYACRAPAFQSNQSKTGIDKGQGRLMYDVFRWSWISSLGEVKSASVGDCHSYMVRGLALGIVQQVVITADQPFSTPSAAPAGIRPVCKSRTCWTGDTGRSMLFETFARREATNVAAARRWGVLLEYFPDPAKNTIFEGVHVNRLSERIGNMQAENLWIDSRRTLPQANDQGLPSNVTPFFINPSASIISTIWVITKIL